MKPSRPGGFLGGEEFYNYEFYSLVIIGPYSFILVPLESLFILIFFSLLSFCHCNSVVDAEMPIQK